MLKALACTALAVVLSGCETNAVTGERELRLLGDAQERSIGEEQYVQQRQQSGGDYVADPALVSYVQSVGAKVAAQSDRDLPYEFVVVNDSSLNAWALPGGKIGINRGLLVAMQDEAELASVLGHEVVHAAAGHTSNRLAKGQLGQLGVAILGAVLDDPGARELAVAAGGLVNAGVMASFSRQDELEADRFGIEYMARAGYDPQGAVRLQQTFLAKSKGGGGVPLFASHPPSADRVEANQRIAAQYAAGKVGKAEYRRATANLRAAQPAYDAYDKGVKALSEKDFESARVQAQAAIAKEPRENLFYELKARAHLGLGQLTQARTAIDRAIARNPEFFGHQIISARIYNEAGDAQGARAAYERSQELLPTQEAQAFLAAN